jgi:hypothetical protein
MIFISSRLVSDLQIVKTQWLATSNSPFNPWPPNADLAAVLKTVTGLRVNMLLMVTQIILMARGGLQYLAMVSVKM